MFSNPFWRFGINHAWYVLSLESILALTNLLEQLEWTGAGQDILHGGYFGT